VIRLSADLRYADREHTYGWALGPGAIPRQ
jgi:hypothetical protein